MSIPSNRPPYNPFLSYSEDLPPPPPPGSAPPSPTNPAHVGAAGGIAPFSSKNKAVKVGDDEEIITAIINAVESSTKLDIDKCKDLKISSSFATTPDGTAVKAMAYRDPPQSLKAPNCYCFERVWEIEVSDKDGELKTITLRKTIFTNIVIPLNSDADLLKDKETMAGIVAGAYSSFVDTAVLVHAGKSKKYALDQITKIQKDQFMTMALFHNQETLKPNKMKQGHGKVVTHVRLEFRAGKKDAKDESPSDYYAYIDLAKKVNDQSVLSLGQQERARKYVLMPDDSSPPEIKQLADLQRFRHLQEEYDSGKDPEEIIDEMEAQDIDVNKAAEMCRTENKGLNRTFEDRLDLFNESSRIVSARNLYAAGTASKVSDTLASTLPKSGKPTHVSGLKTGLKRLFEKTHTNEELGVLKTLVKHRNDKALKAEANEYIGYYRAAYKEMKKIHEKMTLNEDLLAVMSNDDDEIEKLDVAREAREDILQKIKDLLKQEPSSSEESDDDDSSASFSTVKNPFEVQDLSSESSEEHLDSKKKKKTAAPAVSDSSSYTTDVGSSYKSADSSKDAKTPSSSDYTTDEEVKKPKLKKRAIETGTVAQQKKRKGKGVIYNPPQRKKQN